LTSHNVFTLFFRNFIAISLECFFVAIQLTAFMLS
jgi:hypothetical protein